LTIDNDLESDEPRGSVSGVENRPQKPRGTMTDHSGDTARTCRKVRRLPRMLVRSVVVATMAASLSWAFWSSGICFSVRRGSSAVMLIVAGRGCAIRVGDWAVLPHEPVSRVWTMRYALPLDERYLSTDDARVHFLGVTCARRDWEEFWVFVPTAHCIVILLLAIGVRAAFRRPRSQALGFPIGLRPVVNPHADADNMRRGTLLGHSCLPSTT
jgi:hypothetical protein